jgi:hypothetical protein
MLFVCGSAVDDVAFTFVSIVSVEVAVPEDPGVMLGLEKSHLLFFGIDPQLSVVALLKPFTDVSVIVMVTGLPALNVPLVGSSARVKSGGPGHTITATAEDVDAALFASPA